MEWARRLFPAEAISIRSDAIDFPSLRLVMVMNGKTHDLALIFLLLRLRRRTRFFLHLALIFVDGSRLKLVSQLPEDESLEGEGGQYSHCCEDEKMVARRMESCGGAALCVRCG
jgi:hypothetical protein